MTNDKQELQVKIIEKTDKLVKYKMNDFENSPIITFKTNSIQKIEYQNGITDLLGNENPEKNKQVGVSAGLIMSISEQTALITTTVDYFILH